MPMVNVPLPEYTTFRKLNVAQFEEGMEKAIDIKKRIAKLVADLDKLEAELEPLMTAAGVKINSAFDFDGTPVTIREMSGGSHVDVNKLKQLGVRKSVIEAATVPHKNKHYIEYRIVKRGKKKKLEKQEEGEGE